MAGTFLLVEGYKVRGGGILSFLLVEGYKLRGGGILSGSLYLNTST